MIVWNDSSPNTRRPRNSFERESFERETELFLTTLQITLDSKVSKLFKRLRKSKLFEFKNFKVITQRCCIIERNFSQGLKEIQRIQRIVTMETLGKIYETHH